MATANINLAETALSHQLVLHLIKRCHLPTMQVDMAMGPIRLLESMMATIVTSLMIKIEDITTSTIEEMAMIETGIEIETVDEIAIEIEMVETIIRIRAKIIVLIHCLQGLPPRFLLLPLNVIE